jgi:phosphopantetheinyl transferase
VFSILFDFRLFSGCKSNQKSESQSPEYRNFGAYSLSGLNMMIREQSPEPGLRLGIWHITEPAGELLAMLDLSEEEARQCAAISHDLRKRQWLACRVILRKLTEPGSPAVVLAESGKPFLRSGLFHISLSHSGEYAAAACSSIGPVGIDIERMKGRVERVKERFLTAEELAWIGTEHRLEKLHLCWCAKEALYKVYGEPELDFRNDIRIHSFDYLCNMNGECTATLNRDGSQEQFLLNYESLEDYMIAVARKATGDG